MNTVAAEKRLSILLISDSYPPVLGGSEIEAQRVCRALMQRGHRVHVLCAGGPPMPTHGDWVDPLGVPVTILTHCSRGRSKDIVFALRVAWAIWRRRKNTDLVYFLMQGLHVAAGLPAARLSGVPIVMKISGDGIVSLMRQSRAGRLELGWLLKWRVPVMLLNESMFQEAMAAGFPRSQLVWMPNPVDIDEFRPAAPGEAAVGRERLRLPSSTNIAIYVGRLAREKGLQPLIRGFAHAARSAPASLLILVGDGPIRAELELLASEAGLGQEQIRFVGRVPLSDVPVWLRASDVFALTSPNEGFPCALLEAMCAGLPSVVSDIPANLQLVNDGVQGLTVPWDDAKPIGEALLRLFGNPELRAEMANEARQCVVDNYSTVRVAERYEALFAAAIHTGHDPAGAE
jgi:glycosyltransferase involved in cell wall biosynthesis